MKKHAYLLMIHEQTLVLRRLIQLLDDKRNDIYIHIDKKASGVDEAAVKSWADISNVYFVKRHKVYWGTNSIAEAEFELLTAANKRDYQYYHLLSGADMPIKTQDEIHSFFEEHAGKEFIHFGTQQYQKDIASRYEKYHFFMKQLGRNFDKKLWCDMETYSLAIQRRLHIDRKVMKGMTVYGGANWFSITGELASYLVKDRRRYCRAFRFMQNSDELFLQTIVMNSHFKDRIYDAGLKNDYMACVRYIDWERGTPYVFTMNEYEELKKVPHMFARKFDEKKDKEIVEKLYAELSVLEK